jgi:hypothetical protein
MFRFTIRELVLLTLTVAMGVGWWMDRQRRTPSEAWEYRANALADFFRDDGWEVSFQASGVSVRKDLTARGASWVD